MFTEQQRTGELIEEALRTVGQFSVEPEDERYYTEQGGVEYTDDQRVMLFAHGLGSVQLINSVVRDWEGCDEPASKHTFHLHSQLLGYDVILHPDFGVACKLGSDDGLFDEIALDDYELVQVRQLLQRIREHKEEFDKRRQFIAERIGHLFCEVVPVMKVSDSGSELTYQYEGDRTFYDTTTFTAHDVTFYKATTASYDSAGETVDYAYLHIMAESVDIASTEIEFDIVTTQLHRIVPRSENTNPSESDTTEDVTYDERAIEDFERLVGLMID